MGCTLSSVVPQAGSCRSAGRGSVCAHGLRSTGTSSSLSMRDEISDESLSPAGTPRRWISATMWHWDKASFDRKEGAAATTTPSSGASRESDRSRASSVVPNDNAVALTPIALETRPLPPCVAQFQEDQVLRGAVLKPSPHKAPLPPLLDEVDAATTTTATTASLADEHLQGRDSAMVSPNATMSQVPDYFGHMLPWHSAPRRWSAHATTWSGEYPPDLNSVCRPEPVEFMAAPPHFPNAGVRSMDVVASSTPRW